ncbi:hypothetical protein [Streptomyces sp. NPDC002403]
MTGAVVRPVPGGELLSRTQGLRAVCTDAFGGPPWREGPDRAAPTWSGSPRTSNGPGSLHVVAVPAPGC